MDKIPPSPTSLISCVLKFRWIIIILIIGTIGVASAQFLYTGIKSYRSNGVLKEAQASLEGGDFKGAYEKGLLSFKLDPNNPEALRFIANLATRLQSTEAFNFWESLIKLGQQTIADEEAYLAFCLKLRHLEKAAPILQRLLNKEIPSENTISMGIRFWKLQNNEAQAEALVRKGLQLYPKNYYFQLALAEILIESREQTRLTLARKMLWSLSDESPLDIRLRALDLLSKNFVLTPREKKIILNAEALKPDNTNEYLLLGDLKIRFYPFNKKEIIAETLEDVLTITPIEYPQVGAWLVRHGQFESAVRLRPKKESLSDPAYAIIYLDALSGLGDWNALADILFNVQSNLKLDPLVLQVFRTRTALALGDAKLIEAQWEHTFSLAKGNPQALLYVGRYFDRTGVWFYAWQAYDGLLREPSLSMAIGRRMIQMAESRGDTAKVVHVLKKLTKMFPDELGPKNDLAYMNLLLGQEVEDSFSAAQELIKIRPEDMAVRSTMALAFLSKNDPQQAYHLYEGSHIDWKQALPCWQAVYAAVLNANGKAEEARRMILRIKFNQLKPEEMALLKDLI